MLNEQFTWLTPFIQLECPSFAWRTKDAETQRIFVENFQHVLAVSENPRKI